LGAGIALSPAAFGAGVGLSVGLFDGGAIAGLLADAFGVEVGVFA
jgi:hypothetical protein